MNKQHSTEALPEATTTRALAEAAYVEARPPTEEPTTVDGPVDPVGLCSLFIKSQFETTLLSTASGFVVVYEGRRYLVTANHVLSGRHAVTGKCLDKQFAAIPDNIRIAHQEQSDPGSIRWAFRGEKLNDAQGPRWLVHPNGTEIDIAALELLNSKPETMFNPITDDLWDADLFLYPTMLIHVVGFQFGIRPGGVFLPIWKTGHIATEPSMDYERGRPGFYVDATTQEGMSGAPAFARAIGGFLSKEGNWTVTENAATKFIGLYSHHVHNGGLGVVWRPDAIVEVLKAQKRYVAP